MASLRFLVCLSMILGLPLAGCGGGGGDPADGGGGDTGSNVCSSDEDCDDGLFCNGAELCRPDDASSNARGCLAGSVPCGAAERCDDTTDDCVAECPGEADADGDGHDSVACGGDDCDDGNADRFPGNTEICDEVDQDCDPTTLATTEADGDGDGFMPPECCNRQPDGELVCGGDCDDADENRNPDVAEQCNAVDDDCDGETDEVFDCIAGTEESGSTACGRSGTRTCNALCTWPDGYYLEESDETCDYCPDSIDGLADEIAIATASSTFNMVNGNAQGGALGTCFDTFCYVDLNASDAVGGIFAPELEAVPLGYGDTDISLQVGTSSSDATLEHGWALVMYTTTPSDWLGAGSTFGIRDDATGWAVEWDAGDIPDTVRLRRLASGAAGTILAAGAAEALISRYQDVSVTITPDLPTTATVDETAIVVEFSCPSSPTCSGTATASCDNRSGTSCGATLAPGQEILYGVVGARPAGASESMRVNKAEVTRTDLCP